MVPINESHAERFEGTADHADSTDHADTADEATNAETWDDYAMVFDDEDAPDGPYFRFETE